MQSVKRCSLLMFDSTQFDTPAGDRNMTGERNSRHFLNQHIPNDHPRTSRILRVPSREPSRSHCVIWGTSDGL